MSRSAQHNIFFAEKAIVSNDSYPGILLKKIKSESYHTRRPSSVEQYHHLHLEPPCLLPQTPVILLFQYDPDDLQLVMQSYQNSFGQPK